MKEQESLEEGGRSSARPWVQSPARQLGMCVCGGGVSKIPGTWDLGDSREQSVPSAKAVKLDGAHSHEH